jgi:prepilin-type N-terminal cleavage/methylation domain-containing protein/prepilin-type processing-associated H-X9-DG protein
MVARHVFPIDLPNTAMKKTSRNNRGFTLIELLVVIAILAVLAGIGSAALLSATDKAHTAAEVNAAKTLVSAYQAAAADNGGRFLPALDSSATNVLNAQGRPVNNRQARSRYPFRLAPYFNYAIESTLLVGKNQSQMLKMMNLSKPSGPMFDYAVSTFPSLGINRFFVGGTAGANDPQQECVRTVAMADRSIIAFISAGSSDIDGYEYVRAPGAPGGNWGGGAWTKDSDPGNYGHVHPRHNGKAVAAFLDGSTRLLSLEELRDMRLWSRQAALQDDPAYTVSR